MELHEYQAKELLRECGVAIPPFFVASNLLEVEQIITKQKLESAVIKVQVHAGGRGKAGGVKIAKSPNEILEAAKKLLKMKIVTKQTGPDGLIAHKILIAPLAQVAKEYYVGIVIDRKSASTKLLVSSEGGVDIEEVASSQPEKIYTMPLFKDQPLTLQQIEALASFLDWQGDLQNQGKKIIEGLVRAFFDYDATLLEINPLIESKEGRLLALDAKLSVDDNALFRQPKIAAMYDPTQITKEEAEARNFELAYVGLKGNIGCMVNGAGLAMATMDLIRLKGGKPANFLDVGGGASYEKVLAGFKILLSDDQVKAVLVNIFGGIMNCATIASALEAALKELKPSIPIVVRLEGNNVLEAKKILKDSKLQIITADSFDEAAEKVVAEVGK